MVNINDEEDSVIEYGHYYDIDNSNNQFELPHIKEKNYNNIIHKVRRINTDYYNAHYYELDKYIEDDKRQYLYDNYETNNAMKEVENIMIKKYARSIHTFMTALTITTSGLLLYMLFV